MAAPRKPPVWKTHYEVEGRLFKNAKVAYDEAVLAGFKGTEGAIAWRLNHGCRTLAELFSPVNDAISKSRKRVVESKKTEMAAIIAAYDARKAGAG